MSEQNYYGPFSDLSNLISDRYSQDGQFTKDLVNAGSFALGGRGLKNIWHSRPAFRNKIEKDHLRWKEGKDSRTSARVEEAEDHLERAAENAGKVPWAMFDGHIPGVGQLASSGAVLYANNNDIPFMEDTGTWWNPLD